MLRRRALKPDGEILIDDIGIVIQREYGQQSSRAHHQEKNQAKKSQLIAFISGPDFFNLAFFLINPLDVLLFHTDIHF